MTAGFDTVGLPKEAAGIAFLITLFFLFSTAFLLLKLAFRFDR